MRKSIIKKMMTETWEKFIDKKYEKIVKLMKIIKIMQTHVDAPKH